MKYFYTLKIFFYQKNGKFRYSYFLPISSIIIGSYMIFMILCIMNCMEEQLEDRLNALHYKYYLTENFVYKHAKLNKGITLLGFTANGINDGIINVHGIDDFSSFKKNKIKRYLLNQKIDCNSEFLIGDEFANRLNIVVGDTLKLYYPNDINIVFNSIPFKEHIVTGIFDIDFLNYDNNTVLTSMENLETYPASHYLYYFDEEMSSSVNVEYKHNPILNNMIINALKIEKNIYYIFGIFVIAISFFMFFLTLVQSINEKSKEIFIIKTLGLKIKYLKAALLVNSLVVCVTLSLISFFLVNVTVFANIHHNMFDFLFKSIPFKVSYISLYNYESILLFAIIILLSFLSTFVSLISIKRFKLNNNANT